MALDVEQVTRIIVALASTNYQAQHDKQNTHKEGLLEYALLVQNKILTQQKWLNCPTIICCSFISKPELINQV